MTFNISRMVLDERGASRQLAVIIHGWRRRPASMADIRSSVEEQLRDADIIEPTYPADTLSNTNALEVARAIEDFVADTVRDRPRREDGRQYERIVLIGYSIGALIIRQVYLLARGLTAEFRRRDLIEKIPVSRDWVKVPTRMILLAGMNRGWTLSPKPSKMKMRTWLTFWLGVALSSLLRSGRLIRSAQRGAPFVADLRVRWAALQAILDESVPNLEVYQLLGTTDGLVSEEDHADLFLTKGFIFIPIVETNHEEILRLDDSHFGRRRRETFEDVLIRTVDELRVLYRREHERVLARQDLKPEEVVVFIMHGIRDFGRWTKLMADTFNKLYPVIAVRPARYRYFPMGAFLIFNARQKYVRWFMDLYTEEIAKNPSVQISYIGHSNGTYILASAMERYESIEVCNVVFAGSVVPGGWGHKWDRWADMGRIKALQNYIAANDWVVAIFPRLFELIAEITPLKFLGDIGSAGFNGFEGTFGRQYEHVVRGRHSGALDARNHPGIANFVASQKDDPSPALLVGDVDAKVRIASKLCWLIWLFLVAVVVLSGFFIVSWLTQLTPVPSFVWAIVYAFVIWLILETV